MHAGIVVSRAAAIEATWTTAHMACALLRAGHHVSVVEPWDFEIDPAGRALARAHDLRSPFPSPEAFCDTLRRRAAERRYVELAQLDVMLLRVNPLDLGVLGFALRASALGVEVLNDPATLPQTAQKGFVATLSGVPRPSTLVTRARGVAIAFSARFPAGVVVKPTRASGGRGVSFARGGDDRAIEGAVRRAQLHGDGYVVIQEYLPEAEEGEKRLVWLDGRVIGAYLRRRAPGEFRHNLHYGGEVQACTIGPDDLALADAVGPTLAERGIWLAGLDVIGGRLVEVNTLNPGGLHLAQAFGNRDLGGVLVASLENRIEGGALSTGGIEHDDAHSPATAPGCR